KVSLQQVYRKDIMALTSCPSCSKRISTMMNECPHCGFVLSGKTQDQLQDDSRHLFETKRERLVQQSMLGMLVAIGAFAYLALAQPEPSTLPYNLSLGLLIAGGGLYLVNRARMMFLKRKR